MATLTGGNPEDVRRVAMSPRPKGRENAKDTLCRNVTIYGHCRYEEKGCAFNHDPGKVVAPPTPPESSKKRLNVDSPSFTPSSLSVNGQTSKSTGLSPKAASAAPFKPKGVTSAATAPSFTPSLKQYNPNAPDWIASAPEIPEFLPQSYNTLSISLQTSSIEMASHRRGKQRSSLQDMAPTPPTFQATVHASNPAGTIPSSGNLLQRGPSLQGTPPRVFGNVPLYVNPATLHPGAPFVNPATFHPGAQFANPATFHPGAQFVNPATFHPGAQFRDASGYQASNQCKQVNVLRADAQTFHPQSTQGIPLLDPNHLIPNPLQLGASRPFMGNTPVTPSFPRPQNVSSPLFYQNLPAMPLSPYGPQILLNPIQTNPSLLVQKTPNAENNPEIPHSNPFDQYTANTPSIASASHTPQPQLNPYAQDTSALGVPAYFQGQSNYSHPLLHHHYATWGTSREPVQPNQRTARDFFIPEDLRQMLQKKTEATLATFPNSTLPPNIAHFHSLVPLVHNTQKTATLFGYSSWVYKAMSSQDGKVYCLRRLQGYRLTNDATNEMAIRSIQQNWKRVRNGNVVNVYLAFTNSGFGDSSLLFVTDYHPCSETLAQKHFTTARYSNRNPTHVSEQILWGYIVQIASALKAIHSTGLAARVLDPSKVLSTSENRIRLNACAIMDVIKHDTSMSMVELQRQDLHQFGRLIHAIGTNNHSPTTDRSKVSDAFSRSYSAHLRDSVDWLLDQNSSEKTDGIDVFLASIATDVVNVFDSSLHLDDQLVSDLNRELENSRIVRLLVKLNFINERPEYENDGKWAEQGIRYVLVLFRDYVFHQVDGQGNPVLDLAHVLACCNKLDAGIEEKITLTSRDENTVAVVSFREVKAAVEAAWQDLNRRVA